MKRIGLVTALLLALTSAPLVAPTAVPVLSGAEAACTKAPKWKARANPRFGISLSYTSSANLGEDLGHEQQRFGTRIPVLRTWDNGVPEPHVVEQRNEWYGKRWLVTSIKIAPSAVLSGDHDAALRRYFAAMPRRSPVFWNYFHEPEDEVKRGEFSAEQYRRAFRHIAGIAASECRGNLYPTLVLMGWTADPASDLDWHDLYPGKRYVSVLAWDPYNGAEGYASSYRSPRDIAGAVVRASRSAHRPFGIAETGSVRINGDASGEGRADWLRKMASYFRAQNAVFVTYFQSTNNGDFELRDEPSLRAWGAAMH